MDKHDVRRGKDILFADDVTRHIKPLSIKQLRKFVKLIDKLGSTTDGAALSDEEIDTMMDAASIILEKVDPILISDRDNLEEAIDLTCFNEMMNVAMGNAAPEE